MRSAELASRSLLWCCGAVYNRQAAERRNLMSFQLESAKDTHTHASFAEQVEGAVRAGSSGELKQT